MLFGREPKPQCQRLVILAYIEAASSGAMPERDWATTNDDEGTTQPQEIRSHLVPGLIIELAV
jgi:hypothetical protein